MSEKDNKKLCVMCGKEAVVTSYLENSRYRFKCHECGQYFEFNAPSWLAAELIWKYYISKDVESDKQHAI